MQSSLTQEERDSERIRTLRHQLKAAEQKILLQDQRLSEFSEEVKKLAERDREVEGLVKAFSHYHEAKYDEDDLRLTDQCKRCGLDIRNEVHIRTSVIPEEKTDD